MKHATWGIGWQMAVALGLGGALGGCTSTVDERHDPASTHPLQTTSLIVNECQSGSAGYIELENPSAVAIDLQNDPSFCWYVDDQDGGGKPKRIADGAVNHPAGSTTCAAAGRGSTCALVGPGERVWLSYAYINSTTPDQCRLIKAALTAGVCDTSYVDVLAGGNTASTSTGQCFGRNPDGGSWSTTAIACTPNGASNGPSCPSQGSACDDGDACTTGETVQADCSCGGGAAVSCDDANDCTLDACDAAAGCTHSNAADGSACTGGTCSAGQCVAAPPPPVAPTVVINEFSAGNAGWVELYNTGDTVADVSGYLVDDIANGGTAPKTIPAGTTIAAKGRLVVSYGGFNTASADSVRFVDQAGTGVAGPGDSTSNFYAGSSIAGLCFGRQPDGGAWASSVLACTPNASNGGNPTCTVGAACDDGNACTTGETLASDCSCGGGSAVSCDDSNACTSDSCASATGCSHAPLADGTSCGAGLACQVAQCVATNTDAAVVVSIGSGNAVLLRGTVVTPDQVFAGEVLVENDTITCVAASCAGVQPSSVPSVVETHGLIFPGMIDTHNHILFDIFDETDWSPTQTYTNHDQWPNDAKYGAMVDAKQYLNGEYGSTVNVGCEMDKYGELKGLIAGTTSIAGAANPSNKACYGSLARTIDQSPNDLPTDKVQTSVIFPSTSTADGICNNIQSGKTDGYLIHAGEGVDAYALGEFQKLYSTPTVDGCLNVKQTAVIHGTAFGQNEFSSMAAAGMSLIWSPRSNVFLYGAGTDYTKTTNIPLARSFGLTVALAPDWSIGGSQNLLDELRFANQVDDAAFGNVLTPKELTRMVTINAAKVLGLDQVLGSIDVGKKADLFVIGGDPNAPYDALLAARPKDVRLVMVNGVPLYGDTQLQPIAPATPGCEALDVCSASKFVCVAEPGGTATNRLGQTLGDIESVLGSALSSYDALDKSQWDFSPIAPLVKCD